MYSFFFNGMSIIAIFIALTLGDKINFYDIASFLILVLIFIVIITDYLFLGKRWDVFYDNTSIFVRAFTLYIIGKNVIFSQKHSKLVLSSFVIFVLTVFLNLGDSLSIFLDFEGSGAYLFLGDTFAMLSLLLLTNNYYKSVSFNVILFVISSFVLYLIGSRAAFFIYLAVSFLYFFRNFNYVIVTLILLIAGYAILDFATSNFLDDSNRFLRVVNGGLADDYSQIGRALHHQNGMNDIRDNLLFGSYANQYYTLDSPGSYMHNILSYYRQFGLLVFMLIIGKLYSAGKLFFDYFLLRRTRIPACIPYLALFIILECIFLRSYNATHFWLAIGLLSNYQKGIK